MSLRLRALEPEDAAIMLQWENDRDGWQYSDTVAPLSGHQVREYIANYDADPFSAGQLRQVLTDESGVALGLVDIFDLSAFHAHAFVGLYVTTERRREGLGRASIELLKEYAFNTLGLRCLAALIYPDNIPSVRLFESVGFKQSGRLPNWRRKGLTFSDVLLYTLTNNTHH